MSQHIENIDFTEEQQREVESLNVLREDRMPVGAYYGDWIDEGNEENN